MIRIERSSATAVIVIHEIYGINPHMRSVCQTIADRGYDVFCPNLLGEKECFDYSQEEEAYSYFRDRIGFDRARDTVDRLITELKRDYSGIAVVGFSVGATVAWLCGAGSPVDGVVGFYGSRIRDYLDLSPRCPALLFFPEEEKSFQVEELLAALRDKNKAEVHQLKGRHGFGDPFSPHYYEQSAIEASNRMFQFLAGILD